jgi:signal transduction histidine kinase
MRFRFWPAVAASFGALLLLLPLFAWLVSRQAERILTQTRTVRQTYLRADNAISDIQENINKAALMKQSASSIADTLNVEEQLSDLQRTTDSDCVSLIALLGSQQKAQILALQQGLDEYWGFRKQSLVTPQPHRGQRQLFTELESGPEKVLALAGRIDALNQSNLVREEQEIDAQQRNLRRFAIAATVLLLLLELAIAVFSTVYMARLDRVSEKERRRAEEAEHELRGLSNRLMLVQEEERKTISRELHDEVGQLLTGLRMELGTFSRLDPEKGFQERLESVKRLTEEALRSVRNLALLLRPSMLDDLGLESALHWQAKEFSRRCGIPVSVNVHGQVEILPESHRLCLYRVVQEAMTNCGKHADASRISVIVEQQGNRVSMSVHDDGRGFDSKRRPTHGLGLLGMTERARSLQGSIIVTSQPGRGTLIKLELPIQLDPSVRRD